MGALRGLPLARGPAPRPTSCSPATASATGRRSRSAPCRKGMAQTVQLLGTIVHRPRLIVLDEPFSGLDAINQEKLEAADPRPGRRRRRRSSSRPTSSPMPSGCASASRSSPTARSRSKARSTRRAAASGRSSICAPAPTDGPWRSAIPGGARAGRRRMDLRAAARRARAVAQGADRRRRRDRDAEHRAARPARRLRRHRRRGGGAGDGPRRRAEEAA